MKRKNVWTEIQTVAEMTSSLGVAFRTPNEIKEKWNNLKTRIAHLVFNLTSKVDRKCGYYT